MIPKKVFNLILVVGVVFCSYNPVFAKTTEEELAELKSRIAKLEQDKAQQGEGILGDWSDKIHISGVVEVEGFYKDYQAAGTNSTKTSDITLSNVELSIDTDIAEYVRGNVLLKYEDGTDVTVDEGTITLGGVEGASFYLTAGKFVVPFGMFNSHFISDPITLSIGETNDNGVSLGYANDYFEAALGVFNGDIDELGSHDVLESIAASVVFTPSLDGLHLEDVGISLGISYISNIIDSGGFEDTPAGTAGEVQDYVSGLSGFLSLSCQAFTLEAEYVGALESSGVGELVDAKELKPGAWNIELAYAVNDKLEIAGKYECSDGLWDLYPEQQYGPVISYSLFENTTLAVEYLYAEYENGDATRDLVTTQLAIAF